MRYRFRVSLLVLAVVAGLALVACDNGKIELVGQRTTEETPLLGDYVINVHCSFRNTGKTKDVSVVAEVIGAGGQWKKFASGAIAKDENREFKIAFPEPELTLFGDNSYTYRCGLE